MVRFTEFSGLQTITLHLLYDREDQVQFNTQKSSMSVHAVCIPITMLHYLH
jgi:hypothetical protein